MARRTKIVASIGPASEDPSILEAMVAAGMDMARVSLAHGPLEESLTRIRRVQEVAVRADKFVGVLADLPGPKLRAAEFPESGVLLADGALVDIVAIDGSEPTSNEHRVAVEPAVVAVLQEGDSLALGDGAIQLLIRKVATERVTAEVLSGGQVKGRPGLGLPPGRLAISSPTARDLEYAKALVEAEVDALAISFVQSADDIDRTRAVVGSGPMLVAKIETQEAVDCVEAIIATADGVMVARGDLGIRCALEDVPHYQKLIIRSGVAYGRPVITATQMLESMIRAPAPTRAEVSDIANAVFDGTSALMLSGETAIGHDPVKAVRTMSRIAVRAEREFDNLLWGRELGRLQSLEVHGQKAPIPVRMTAAVSAAAWRAATDAEATAIIACTIRGTTARAISRFRPIAPVLAVTPSPRTARQLSVAWGITPILVDWQGTTDDIVWFAVKATVERGYVRSGDLVAVLVGSPTDPNPTTDTLRLVRVQ
ncbi:MAG: pyruvate kinase [Actinomycetota bacterium]|nr:pyruvate kinase [Actinomycetota bacterium]